MSGKGRSDGREFFIDGDRIADDSDCYVIAEIGHNHQGSLEKAKEFFDEAKRCGASAVKLQKRSNRTLYTPDYFSKPYEHENSYGATYGEHREFLEFDREEYQELRDHAAGIGITFFATAFDFESVELLADLDMPAYKVASGDLKNIPLIELIAETGKPMIISTGGATLRDVRRAFEVATDKTDVAILQCTAGYPPSWDELDLRVIDTYRELFPDTVVGLSSHDSGIAMAIAAYVLGARILEKHFTLNRAMKGTDHSFSLEPQGMEKMVRDLQRTRLALGDGEKKVYSSEVDPIVKMGKKLVATRDLAPGEVLEEEDIALCSPGDGVPPSEIDRFIGSELRQPVAKAGALSLEMVEDFDSEKAELGPSSVSRQ